MLALWVPLWFIIRLINGEPGKLMDHRTVARVFMALVIVMYPYVGTECGSKPIGAAVMRDVEAVVLLFIVEVSFALLVGAGELVSAMIHIETKNENATQGARSEASTGQSQHGLVVQ